MALLDKSVPLLKSSRLWRVGFALVCVAMAVAIRLALEPLLGNRRALFALAFAIGIAAHFGGRISGIVATIGSALAAWFFFVEPYFTFRIADPRDVPSLIALTITGLAMSLMMERDRDRYPVMQQGPADTSPLLRRTLLLGLAAIALVGLTRLLFADFDRERERQQWIAHSYLVLNEIGALQSAMQDAETGQRGYLLTGRDEYLEPYRHAAERVQVSAHTIETLNAGNAEQLALLAKARQMMTAKFDELQQTIDMHRAGRASSAIEMVQSGVGKRLMDECRRAFAAMDASDRAELDKHVVKGGEESMRMRWVLGLGSVSLLALLAVAGAVIERDNRRGEQLRRIATRNEERLLLAMEAAKAGTWEWDAKTEENVWSDQLWRLFGLERDGREASGALWQSIVHPDDYDRALDGIVQAAKRLSEISVEYRVTRADGEERWLLSRGRLASLPVGNQTRYVGIVVDITERKRAELERERAERRLKFAMESGDIGYWEVDTSKTEVPRTPFHDRLFGPDQPGAMWSFPRLLELVAEEDRDKLREMRRKLMEEGGSSEVECRIHATDGVERWMWLRCARDEEAGGGPHLLAVGQDITARKRAELLSRQEAERELETLREFIVSAPLALILLDRELRVIQASRRWLELFRKEPERVVGHAISEVFPGMPPEWHDVHQRALQGESIATRRDKWVSGEGAIHWLNWELQSWGDAKTGNGGVVGYCEDVTDQVVAEQTAQIHELRYRAIFRNMSEGLLYCRVIYDQGEAVDWLYLEANEAFEKVTGLRNVVGRKLSEVLPDFAARDTAILRLHCDVATTGIPALSEHYSNTLNKWYSSSTYCPARGEFVTVFADITERKAAEAVQAERERDLQRFAEFAPVAIAMFDREMRYLAASQRFRDDFDLGDRELIGHTHYEIFPEIPDRWRAIHQRCLAGATESSAGDQFIRADGREQWLRWEVQPWRKPNGEIGGIVMFSEDITFQREAERQIHESEERLRLSQQAAHIGTFDADMVARTMKWTPEMEAIYGMPPGTFSGRPEDWERHIHPDDHDLVRQKVAESMQTGSFEAEWRVIWPDGSEHWLSGRASIVRDAQGRPIRMLGVNIDITEIRVAEMEVRRLNAELEERVRQRTIQLEAANKELESFSYSVSHDLRAPLRGIDGWSLALVEDYGHVLDENGKRFLGRVRSEAQRLGQLIDDILVLSRVTRSELRAANVDLAQIAAPIAGRLQERAPERAVDFVIAPALPCKGDARMLEVALTNLLENAYKFTSKQEHARIELGHMEHGEETVFFVRDNGVGFDMQYASALFGAFQRLHRASEFPGSGIGLATVQRVIRKHGGRIWAEAELGVGATFFFTIGTDV